MREIKFRAWDKYNHKMTCPDYISCEGECYDLSKCYGEGLDNNSDKYILMQFTDILDKNGKEIYEGDIVRYTSYNSCTGEPEENIFPVTWNEKGSGFMFCHGGEKREVIGNIFENIELIEQGE